MQKWRNKNALWVKRNNTELMQEKVSNSGRVCICLLFMAEHKPCQPVSSARSGRSEEHTAPSPTEEGQRRTLMCHVIQSPIHYFITQLKRIYKSCSHTLKIGTTALHTRSDFDVKCSNLSSKVSHELGQNCGNWCFDCLRQQKSSIDRKLVQFGQTAALTAGLTSH